MKATYISTVALVALFVSTSARAEWQFEVDKDDFTDEETPLAWVHSDKHAASRLVLGCVGGKLRVLFEVGEYLGNRYIESVLFRVVDNNPDLPANSPRLPALPSIWNTAVGGDSLFLDDASQKPLHPFVRIMWLSGFGDQTLKLRVKKHNGTNADRAFSLIGVKDTAGKVLEACGYELP